MISDANLGLGRPLAALDAGLMLNAGRIAQPARAPGLSRRGMLGGLLALAAPSIIRTPGLLMPIKARTEIFNILLQYSAVDGVTWNDSIGTLDADIMLKWFLEPYRRTLKDIESYSFQELKYA